ncbi:MAG: glycosyl transferase family 1 [Crocinitomicaceae bacterium]|nr:glycosyl transferase family 1 [Crocinitomicaceae bacterium]
MKNKALLITYYWPPAGGPGVHRWLRFSNYFKENNWDLVVYCPKDAAWPIIDQELIHEIPQNIEVIHQPIFEPQKYIQKKTGFTGGAGLGTTKNKSFFKQFIIWIRGNLFIPDARRFWIKPSARFLTKYLTEHPEITHIISTGPPHSMHLIGKKLKQQFPYIKWVADFRDPWTEIDFYSELNIGKWADKQQKKLEKTVLTNADLVLAIGDDCAKGLERIGGRKVEIITNGYQFPDFDPYKEQLDTKFTISHFGSMAPSRNPTELWEALRQLLDELPELKNYLQIQLFGSVDFSIIESINLAGLSDFFTGVQQLSHAESIQHQRKSQVLLLVANKAVNSKGILTGKFFEYLGAKRPMLVIGELESDLEKIVTVTQSGYFVDYTNVEKAKISIKECFSKFSLQQLYVNSKNTEQFHSSTLTKKMLQLFEGL